MSYPRAEIFITIKLCKPELDIMSDKYKLALKVLKYTLMFGYIIEWITDPKFFIAVGATCMMVMSYFIVVTYREWPKQNIVVAILSILLTILGLTGGMDTNAVIVSISTTSMALTYAYLIHQQLKADADCQHSPDTSIELAVKGKGRILLIVVVTIILLAPGLVDPLNPKAMSEKLNSSIKFIKYYLLCGYMVELVRGLYIVLDPKFHIMAGAITIMIMLYYIVLTSREWPKQSIVVAGDLSVYAAIIASTTSLLALIYAYLIHRRLKADGNCQDSSIELGAKCDAVNV
ncbi:unnamed protein product [Medioppia subpectinata]|uniref:Uncharacterized protein n=1 Tax=Medioppia subpectinata TaxID=1979941 RepID=A0A7R9PVK7_9ACAR|nr:unnamed protein product [Medioppia subpectinata]CAG2102807.1 unnamed protein product [Medioppia subpectinata]